MKSMLVHFYDADKGDPLFNFIVGFHMIHETFLPPYHQTMSTAQPCMENLPDTCMSHFLLSGSPLPIALNVSEPRDLRFYHS